MSDRELIRMAAKAACAEWTDYSDRTPDHWIIKHVDGVWREWDPLEDDGDALRLAADLDINIEWFPKQRYVSAGRLGVGENIGWVDESGRRGALRRAITVAASRIGRAMP